MSNQSVQTMAHKTSFSLGGLADQLGVLILLALGLSTAGATILVGL
jgi:hypothetical protein